MVTPDPTKFVQDADGQWWYRWGGKSKKQQTRAKVVVCGYCNDEFVQNPVHRGRYCGRSCGVKDSYRTRPKRGAEGKRWKGGYVNRRGYILVWMPDHPDCQGNARNYVIEHRLVMEKKLGRYLRRGEQVHHLNGVRDDNRPENLELWVHQQPAGARVGEGTPHCPTCTCYGEHEAP